MKTDFIGFLLGEGCLILDVTTLFLFPVIILISHGVVFGRIRFP
jgi:hypothetical protein